jgi:hypothetical protein
VTLQLADITSALSAVGAPSTIARTFELMGVAEEEIKVAKSRHPSKAQIIDDSFMELVPPDGMLEFGNLLYRCFVKERLDQIARGHQRTATNAEVAMTISRVSNKTPIHQDFAAAYWLAMCDMLGTKTMQALVKDEAANVYTTSQLKEGQERLDEIKNDINRRLLQQERKKR